MPAKRSVSAAKSTGETSKGQSVDSLPTQIDGAWIREFQGHLLKWFTAQGRDLPWRGTRDPYRILVSETMLQQTTTQVVRSYYQRFLETFPTVRDLAAAPIESVLKAWEGLGYYRRAKSLQAAARIIVERYDGHFPQEFDDVLALPGVGRYTAGAVGSFAFDRRWPIVEANTGRLYARLLACRSPLQSAAAQGQLWSLASRIVDCEHPAAINHALMDLGAAVCTVRQPNCLICPVRQLCLARRLGLQNDIPPPKIRRAPKDICEYVLLIQDTRLRWFVHRRPAETWWAGLWDFPRFHVSGFSEEELHATVERAAALIGCDIRHFNLVMQITYGVTTHRITSQVVSVTLEPAVKLREKPPQPPVDSHSPNAAALAISPQREWIELRTLDDLALTANARKLSNRLKEVTDRSKK